MEYTIFLIPIIMILSGYLMSKYPPKKINYLIGYRTSQSMKNKKHWQEANKYCGILWIKLGTILLVISLLIFILITVKALNYTENLLTIIILVQTFIIILSIPLVENKIKKLK